MPAEELGAREGQDVPGPAGPEGRHQGGGADLRDAEEPLEIAAREELTVEPFELLDGVGDREHCCRLRTHGRHRQSGRRWPAAPFAFESARMIPSTTLLLVAGRRQRELRMKDVIALLNDQRSELLDSVARIDAAIAALGVTPRPSAPSRQPAKRRRREMSAEAKQAVSDRMKSYWAERRKQTETTSSGDAANADDAPIEA